MARKPRGFRAQFVDCETAEQIHDEFTKEWNERLQFKINMPFKELVEQSVAIGLEGNLFPMTWSDTLGMKEIVSPKWLQECMEG